MAVFRTTTWLSTRMPDGKKHRFISGGGPCETQGGGGWKSREEMVKALKDRWKNSHSVADIPLGVRLTPLPGKGGIEDFQDVEFID